MRDKTVQTKHLSDAEIVRAVGVFKEAFGVVLPSHVRDMYPGVPNKIVIAKLKGLIRRNLVNGCACGCRGDFEIAPAGHKFLRETCDDHGAYAVNDRCVLCLQPVTQEELIEHPPVICAAASRSRNGALSKDEQARLLNRRRRQ